jgi:hypothetical protein
MSVLSNRQLLLEQAPIFVASFLIANVFYKFGSFGIELVAFLFTWFCIDAAVQFLRKKP